MQTPGPPDTSAGMMQTPPQGSGLALILFQIMALVCKCNFMSSYRPQGDIKYYGLKLPNKMSPIEDGISAMF